MYDNILMISFNVDRLDHEAPCKIESQSHNQNLLV